ncbi:MAG: ribosome assembly cofactor RimP [Bacteroidetes bacterium]|nr:ribosome assembly cofactor RimP [Bacteroidota bacterium]
MLDKTKIESIVNDYLQGSDKFLVGIDLSSTNVIDVFVDGDEGISIGECVKISRLIESAFDREEEDYELRVSSPGLDKPFKLLRQYKKYIGRDVRVEKTDGSKLKGKLLDADESTIKLEKRVGKKGENTMIEAISMADIKAAKPEISFK